MKKLIMMVAAVAMTAATFVACNGDVKADLKDGVDSLAYDLGVAQAPGLKQYMSMQLGVDSAYIDEFIKGMNEGALNENDPAKDAYMAGLQVGKQVQQMAKGLTAQVFEDDSTQNVNVKNLLAGLAAGLKGTDPRTWEEADADYNNRFAPIKEAQMMKQYGANKEEGEKYLAANAKKEGVTTTKSGLQYKVLVEGDGALPTDTATLSVNYEGKLLDGTVFDSSYERGTPITINMAHPGVIEGWVEVLKLMPAGSKWEVTIPQNLAYGSRNMGQIKPFSTLIFTIEVVK